MRTARPPREDQSRFERPEGGHSFRKPMRTARPPRREEGHSEGEEARRPARSEGSRFEGESRRPARSEGSRFNREGGRFEGESRRPARSEGGRFNREGGRFEGEESRRPARSEGNRFEREEGSFSRKPARAARSEAKEGRADRSKSGKSKEKTFIPPLKRIPKKGDRTGQKPLGHAIDEPMRLNRYIASAGITSRRKADELIQGGAVRVNGKVVDELGLLVKPGDQVQVDGKVITPQRFVYLLLNKPVDTITTVEDDRGRQTVLDLVKLPEELGDIRIYPVGRLDRDTEGILVLTNDGELANRLMHPRYQIEKYYIVETRDSVKPHELAQLKDGIELEDGMAYMDEVDYVALPNHKLLGVMLHEGRNRQIRRMIEAIGHRVHALERIQYASLTLSGVRRGKWRHLTPAEVKRLRHMVKLK